MIITCLYFNSADIITHSPYGDGIRFGGLAGDGIGGGAAYDEYFTSSSQYEFEQSSLHFLFRRQKSRVLPWGS